MEEFEGHYCIIRINVFIYSLIIFFMLSFFFFSFFLSFTPPLSSPFLFHLLFSFHFLLTASFSWRLRCFVGPAQYIPGQHIPVFAFILLYLFHHLQ